MIITQEEMKFEIEEAIENSPYSKKEVAMNIGTRESNISNLLSPKRNIAIGLLQDVVKFLNNYHLQMKAAEFCLDLKLLPISNFTDMPQIERFGAIKEENERKQMETDRFNTIMSKLSSEWTIEDIQFMEAYDKELVEEANKEYSYHISIAQKIEERKQQNEYIIANAN